MKTKNPVYIPVFSVVNRDGDVIHLTTWPQTKHEVLHQVPARLCGDMNRVVCCKNPTSWNMSLRQLTQSGEPLLSRQRISATPSPLTSGCITPQIKVHLIIMFKAWLGERSTKFCATPKMTAEFTNLSKKTVSEA